MSTTFEIFFCRSALDVILIPEFYEWPYYMCLKMFSMFTIWYPWITFLANLNGRFK